MQMYEELGIPVTEEIIGEYLRLPEVAEDFQRRYVQAGSQVLYAPTFGANRVKLERWGADERLAEINRDLVAISRRAAEGKALVAGDLSPTGCFLAPVGDKTFEELVQAAGLKLPYAPGCIKEIGQAISAWIDANQL